MKIHIIFFPSKIFFVFMFQKKIVNTHTHFFIFFKTSKIKYKNKSDLFFSNQGVFVFTFLEKQNFVKL